MVSLLFTMVLSPVFCQDKISFGKCPFDQVSSVKNIESQKFEGTWYEIYYDRNPTTNCIEGIYNWKFTNHSTRSFSIKQEEHDLQKGTISVETREIQQISKTDAKYEFVESKLPLWIVSTDYDSYAILWSCWDGFTPERRHSIQRLTILSRNRHSKITPTEATNPTLNKKLNFQTNLTNQEFTEKSKHDTEKDDITTLTTGGILSTIVMIIASKLL